MIKRLCGIWCSVLLMVVIMGGSAHPQVTIPDNTHSPLGVNFWFFADWAMYYYPFVDFFRSSRAFWPQPAASTSPWSMDGVTLDLDGDGYPRSLPDGVGAATLLFWAGDNLPVPAGNYTLLYDGDGDITFAYNCSVVSQEPGRIVVNVTGAGGILVKIARTNPADHVRNIRFIMPGFEDTWQTQRFHPEFLRRLKPFRALRFMDWLATNESDNDTWENRITRSSQTYATDRGVALEEMIALCNELEADPWFCFPHGADDTFIRNFVTMVRDSLKPHLKAYYEYSNEVWLFPKAQTWARNYGEQLGGGTGWGATVHGWSTRAVEMMKIVADVYGNQMSTRAVRVLGTQVGNTGVASGLLSVGDAPNHFDAIAVAPYFNNGNATGSVDAVVNAVAQSASQVDEKIAGDLSVAREHNMQLIAYEGGLDIWNTRDTWGPTVRFDPRMKAIFKDYLERWKAGGGELFVQYTFCNPQWGLLRDQEQNIEDAPMYMAALEFIEENPRWWSEERLEATSRQAVPAAITPRSGTISLHRRGAGLPPDVKVHGAHPGAVALVGLDGRHVARATRMTPATTKNGSTLWRFAQAPAPGVYLVRVEGAARARTVELTIR